MGIRNFSNNIRSCLVFCFAFAQNYFSSLSSRIVDVKILKSSRFLLRINVICMYSCVNGIVSELVYVLILNSSYGLNY